MQEFIKYFKGLERDFGFCNITKGYKDPETGKIKFNPGDYGWAGKPIKNLDYEEHLEGKKSIGIQPCDDNSYASFGAIDIDPKTYKNFNIKFYLDIIQQKQLPIIPIKSKSNGLHLYVFTEEPVKALEIKEFLEQLLFLFNLTIKTEIFPKQTKLGSNTEGQKMNGNFINLPYFNKIERVALNPDGTEMSLDTFLQCVELNKVKVEQLRNIKDKIIKDELTGGADEFKDGPPCLGILTKDIMIDNRDRFLFNYMVFAKKKYSDDWKTKVLEAARNYFKFDQNWTDDHVKQKIKSWDKPTAGHTCHQDPINTVCVKSECIKRKYGIASEAKASWPVLGNLQKIDFKPDPEYYFTVEREDGETVPVHAKDINKIKEQKEMTGIIMAQADIPVPPIKRMEFFEIIRTLFDNLDTVQPAPGTRPHEILHKHLTNFVNETKATNYHSFKSGNVYKDEVYAYFVYDEFYSYLKDREWKKDSSRTSHMIEKLFDKPEYKDDPKPEFNKKKRYPGKDKKTDKPFPGVNGCAMIPLYIFKDEEEDVEEIVSIEDEKDIV
tara:strand:- start:2031 stop:3680 length:1650 start_codon:yes stop_codon:yes gene_type:complete